MVIDAQKAPSDSAKPNNVFAQSKTGSLLDGVMEAASFSAKQKQNARDSYMEEMVRSEDLRLAWQACTSSINHYSLAEQKDCMASVATLRSEFLTAYADVPDEDDRTVLSTIFCINLKSQWIILNIWSGYRIAAGKPDELLMCRLGMLSALLDCVEKALSRDDVSAITDFLAHPVSRPAPGSHILEPLPQNDALSLPALSHHNSRKLREMRETIANQEAEMTTAREKDAFFLRELGTCDGTAIVRQLQEAQSQLSALKDLQDMLGGVEASMDFVNS